MSAALGNAGSFGAGGVLRQYAVASFAATGNVAIQAMAEDAFGNVYVAGTTNAPDFPVRNAAQPALGDSRLMRSTDFGATWKPVGSPPADLTGVTADPADPATLFASSATAIYKSTDAGATWRTVFQFSGYPYPQSAWLVIDPGNHLHLAAIVPATGAVTRSLDGGNTWAATGATAANLVADPTGSGALLSGAYLSLDWGASFQRLQLPAPGNPMAMAFDPSHRGWIYLELASGTQGTFWLSTDFGATWTARASPNDTFNAFYTVAVDPAHPNSLIGATPDGIFVSTDGAASWTGPRRAVSLDEFTPLVVLPEGVLAITGAGAAASVAFSPDYGLTWTTPQLSGVTAIAAGPRSVLYAARQISADADAFVAKLASDGSVLWATYLGGSDQDRAVALAADSEGNIVVAGNTLSPDFPVTAPGSGTVFLTRYSAAGVMLSSQLLGSGSATGVAVDGSGNSYVAARTFLAKAAFDGTDGYRASIPGTTWAVAVNGAGQAAVAASDSGGIFVTLLDTAGLQTLATARIAGAVPWAAIPDLPQPLSSMHLAEDAAGNLYLFSGTGSDLPASPGAYDAPKPLTQCLSPYGPEGNAFVAKLAAGSLAPVYTAVLRAPCGIAPGSIAVDSRGAAVLSIAALSGLALRQPILGSGSAAVARLSPDGATLEFATYLEGTGIPFSTALYTGVESAVFRLEPPAAPLSIDGVANAFSGDSTAVVEGGLYTLSVSAPDAQVSIGGVPAQIVRTDAGSVTVLMPFVLGGFAPIQLSANGAVSQIVWMPIAASQPGLSTYILNSDGTVNDAAHPAAPGTTITLFATGLGPAPVWTTWDQGAPPWAQPPAAAVAPAPGMPGVFQIQVVVPVAAQPGTLPIALQSRIYADSGPRPASNWVDGSIR